MMCRRQTRRLGLVLSQFLTTAASSSAAAAAAGNCSAPAEVDYDHYLDYKLLDSTPVSPDSKLLRFELPPQHRPTLGLPLPSCLKVKKTFVDEQSGEQYVLDKSYSPVSMPDQPDWVEFLVKGYAARPAGHGAVHGGRGGLGAFLVSMEPGQTAQMLAKKPRMFHGEAYVPGRWDHIGFLAGGTGIAPMLQMIRTILSNRDDAATQLSLVFANRDENDILARAELDELAEQHAARFRVRYVLSSPPQGSSLWAGGTGWITAEDVAGHLPSPADDNIQVLVCGRDEFVQSMGGLTGRAPPPPGKKKGPKIQGELTGLLAETGYKAEQVYKF